MQASLVAVSNVKLKISESIVQKGFSFLISHGKKLVSFDFTWYAEQA